MPVAAAGRNSGLWKILVVSPDSTLASALARMLSEHLPYAAVTELREYPTHGALTEALAKLSINLCFVDVSTHRERALMLLDDLSSIDARLPIVGLHSTNDSDYILRTLRQGAIDGLFQPITSDHFLQVVERLAASHRGPTAAVGKLVCVMPAKGACGASTLACNLAVHWRKTSQPKLLLADLDPLTGTVGFQLKLKQTYSFMDALSRAGELDEDVWNGLVQQHSGFDVVPSPEQPVHGIDEGYEPGSLLEFVRSLYQVSVIDSSGAYGAFALGVARYADEILLVTTNELPALQATQRALAYLERNQVDSSRVKVIVNRYRPEIGLSCEVIETALHRPVFHQIPSDYESIQRALMEGKSVPTGNPVGRAMSDLAQRLAGTAPEAATKPKSRGLFSFLRR